jgi:CBS domain-containing protein
MLEPLPLVAISENATVGEAARRMRDARCGSILVTEDERLIGIFTERDVMNRVVAEGLDPERTSVSQVMTRSPRTVEPDTPTIVALRIMDDGGFRHLPVVDKGRILGIVSRRDFLSSEQARIETERHYWERC